MNNGHFLYNFIDLYIVDFEDIDRWSFWAILVVG